MKARPIDPKMQQCESVIADGSFILTQARRYLAEPKQADSQPHAKDTKKQPLPAHPPQDRMRARWRDRLPRRLVRRVGFGHNASHAVIECGLAPPLCQAPPPAALRAVQQSAHRRAPSDTVAHN